MNAEAEQPVSTQRELQIPAAGTSGTAAAAKAVSARRKGVPVWRTGKPDAFLAAAVDTARTAIEGITAAATIGRHLAAKSEGDRLVTHLFESRLPGYVGWQWYAVLTRNSRSKVVTVNELGLLPSEDSILAPEWVPWAERVRPEDAQQQESEGAEPEEALLEAGEAAPVRDGEEAAPAGGDPDAADFDADVSDVVDGSSRDDAGEE
ncbi:DUF3027 domain-containing protein [Pseudarthrobacter sp. NamE5]|uniref:DUF3027 domain-containing protein n=1 Tax=Pseudarthrobacter sp. NamE5 TaxID=2576839 RepID=UPI00110B1E90|nr:DUF3027 domain-containing protein [Pseudarthrobacter sp. NamE5]TLM84143.1 DUF3027 domain-containing protein [Pseudarthrobacter sp. NamE5]